LAADRSAIRVELTGGRVTDVSSYHLRQRAPRASGREERSAKIEDQLESLVDTSYLVERQVCHLTPEGARIDCPDQLAHDPRLLVADRHLGMEACWWR
jgi:hypothetical protein